MLTDEPESIDPLKCLEEDAPNEYREAAIKFIAFMHGAISFIQSARDHNETAIRLQVVASAIDHPSCEGRSDTEQAASVGTTRANLSKHKIAFCRESNLPPTFGQKSIEARGAYRKARKEQLGKA